jgi:hypothetical protein
MRTMLFFFAALMGTASAVLAHHGGSMYDRDTEVVVTGGVVKQLLFVNPHARLLFTRTDEQGQVEEWEGELSSPNDFVRAGIYEDFVKPGDAITVKGSLHRSRPHDIRIDAIVLGDGAEVLVP